MIEFVIYQRVYCHLCHDMEEALRVLLRQEEASGCSVVLIDVDADEKLELQFGERVPVLMAGERELCHYFLDVSAVREYLAETR